MNNTSPASSARARLKTMLMRLSVPESETQQAPTAHLTVHSSRDESGHKFSLAAKVAMTALVGAALFCHNDPTLAQGYIVNGQQANTGYGVPVFVNPNVAQPGFASNQRFNSHSPQGNLPNGYVPLTGARKMQAVLNGRQVTQDFILQLDNRAPEAYNALMRFPESRQTLQDSHLPPEMTGLLASCIETKLKILGHQDHEIRSRATALMISQYSVQAVNNIRSWAQQNNQQFSLGVAAYCMEGEKGWRAQANVWIERVKGRSPQVGEYVLDYLGTRAIGDAQARTEAALRIDRDIASLDRSGAPKVQNTQPGEIFHVATTDISTLDLTAERPAKLAAAMPRQ